MITTRERTAIDRYLDAVRTELADLPDDDRVEMLEDVEQHLLEVAAEGDEPIETRLGPPAEYAAELRVAAGLPNRVSEDDPFAQRLAARISASRFVRTLNSLRGTRGYAEAAQFVRSLQPAWWVARAYIATVLLGSMTNDYSGFVSLFPRVGGSRLVGVLVLIALTIASVVWGRRARGKPFAVALTLAASAVLLVVGFQLFNDRLNNRSFRVEYVDSPYNPGVVRGPYGNILNIYPYALDGTPLKDVLLFDQNGNPIPGVVMDRLTQERLPRDQSGQLIPNVFPYPEAVVDARTGEIVGERTVPPMPLRVPPKLPEPSMSAQPAPTAEMTSSVASPTAAPSASAAPPASGSATPSPTTAPSPTTSPPASPTSSASPTK